METIEIPCKYCLENAFVISKLKTLIEDIRSWIGIIPDWTRNGESDTSEMDPKDMIENMKTWLKCMPENLMTEEKFLLDPVHPRSIQNSSSDQSPQYPKSRPPDSEEHRVQYLPSTAPKPEELKTPDHDFLETNSLIFKEEELEDDPRIDEEDPDFVNKTLGSCLICNFTYSRLQEYITHKKLVHGCSKRHHPCDDCNYVGTSMIVLKRHIDSVHRGLKKTCNVCGAAFSNAGNLRKHQRAVHEGLRYKCTQCEYECTRPETLKSHKDRVHEEGKLGGGEPRVQCHLCAFMTPRHKLKHHIDIEHVGLRFYCDKCEFESKSKYLLRDHILTKHEGIRYSCDECSSSFSDKYNFNAHKKTHRQPKAAHPCDQCSEVFSTKENLKRHQGLRKVDFKPFSCDLCGNVFCLETNLIRHRKRKHTSTEDMIPCDLCSKAFYSKQNLNRHKKIKHSSILPVKYGHQIN